MGLLNSKFARYASAFITEGLYATAVALPLVLSAYTNAIVEPATFQTDDSQTFFILSGGSGRIEWGLKTAYEEDFVVVIGANPETELNDIWKTVQADAEHVFIPQEHVDIEKRSLTTEGNAMQIAAFIEQRKLKSAVIVTSDYHAARANYLIKQTLPDDIDISFLTINSDADLALWAEETAKLACHMIEPCHKHFSSPPMRDLAQ